MKSLKDKFKGTVFENGSITLKIKLPNTCANCRCHLANAAELKKRYWRDRTNLPEAAIVGRINIGADHSDDPGDLSSERARLSAFCSSCVP